MFGDFDLISVTPRDQVNYFVFTCYIFNLVQEVLLVILLCYAFITIVVCLFSGHRIRKW